MRYLQKCYPLIIFFIVFLNSCSTPYQPKGLFGGYSSLQLADNIFNVTFYGNQHTSPEKVRMYLYYYSAELTLQNGFEYYYVASDFSHFDERTIKKEYDAPGKTTGTMSGGVNTKVVPSFSDPSIIKTYMGNFVIHMFKDEVPEHKKYLIYAPQIIKDFGIKIKR